jgi:hypothetical protein
VLPDDSSTVRRRSVVAREYYEPADFAFASDPANGLRPLALRLDLGLERTTQRAWPARGDAGRELPIRTWDGPAGIDGANACLGSVTPDASGPPTGDDRVFVDTVHPTSPPTHGRAASGRSVAARESASTG